MNGFLLDTNVVSELRKGARADKNVSCWIAERKETELFISVITLAELRRGIALLKPRDSDQADVLAKWCDQVEHDFGRTGHLLPIREAEANSWGDLMSVRNLPVLDAFLAATAISLDLTLVTRNVSDFHDLPLAVENPFASR